MRLCQLAHEDGIDRPVLAKEMCSLHYQRTAKYGDPYYCVRPLTYKQKSGIDSPRHKPWAGYKTVHRWLLNERGPATEQTCGCGQPAKEWALPHDLAEEEYVWENLMAYTRNIWRYVALCYQCHRHSDNQHRRALRSWS